MIPGRERPVSSRTQPPQGAPPRPAPPAPPPYQQLGAAPLATLPLAAALGHHLLAGDGGDEADAGEALAGQETRLGERGGGTAATLQPPRTPPAPTPKTPPPPRFRHKPDPAPGGGRGASSCLQLGGGEWGGEGKDPPPKQPLCMMPNGRLGGGVRGGAIGAGGEPSALSLYPAVLWGQRVGFEGGVVAGGGGPGRGGVGAHYLSHGGWVWLSVRLSPTNGRRGGNVRKGG